MSTGANYVTRDEFEGLRQDFRDHVAEDRQQFAALSKSIGEVEKVVNKWDGGLAIVKWVLTPLVGALVIGMARIILKLG